MSDADPAGDTFAAFASFLGTPLPENPIEALRILRREAAKEIERLIAFLDAVGGDPDLEPSLGYARRGDNAALVDIEGDGADDEPSLGWTGAINQASSNRVGGMDDCEKNDCDKEHTGDEEPSMDMEPCIGWTDGEASSGAYTVGSLSEAEAPSPRYLARLRSR